MFGAGFLWSQHEPNAGIYLPPFVSPDQLVTPWRKLFEAWVEENKPDAILTDIVDLPKVLEKAGYRIPEDIGIAATTIRDIPADAGIDQNPEEIGRVAVLVAISLLYDNDCGEPKIAREILVNGTWVDGASLPARVGSQLHLPAASAGVRNQLNRRVR
jgi:hypothetical protein